MATNITDILAYETGRYLPGTIYGRMFATSPWISFMKRGTYPAGLSESINVLTYGRTAPIAQNGYWANVSRSAGTSGGACLPTAQTIGFGSKVRSFQVQRYVVEGPDFCAEDFRSHFDLRLQLDRIADILTEYTRMTWEDRDRHEYFRLVANKVVANGCGAGATNSTSEATTYPAIRATQTLSMGLLDYWKIRLLRDGAARGPAALYNNGSPVLKVIASQETIGHLIRDNSDIREDLRWADSGRGDQARLVKAFGVNNTYGGFAFFADPYPRRFTESGGTYTEVDPFVSSATTNGNQSVLNDAWLVAPFEETFIFDEEVMHQLIPQPIVAPQPMFKFDPVKYVGTWSLKNIPNRTDNPDGTILYHRGILEAASMPVHPERGVAIVHKRCDPACGALSVCAS